MGLWQTTGSSVAEGWWMFYDTLWALVLGFTLSGAVQAFVSRRAMQRRLGDHRTGTIATASVLGMVSSSCSYAASALAKSLFAKGADFTASMAFMFASTNLVIELGMVLWLLIGWQFALAEFVGGAIMIALLTLLLPRVVRPGSVEKARARLSDGAAPGAQGGHGTDEDAAPSDPHTRAGWTDAAGYTISDLTMIRKELVIGFLVAGFAAVAVPVSFWQSLFLTGHGWVSAVENAVVAPVLACISFVCSVGNVPLAAALWKGGIGFGGVIAFVFADLLALPLVLIYRRYYGARLTVRLVLTFWAVMSTAGLLTELVFHVLGLTPARLEGQIATTHVGLNVTTVLNAIAVVAFGYLFWLHRNRERFGGGAGLAQDPVCGMQVRTTDAPARTSIDGQQVYFCSDRCHDRFLGDRPAPSPDQGGGTTPGRADAGDGQAVDPVCGMRVDPEQAAATVEHDGARWWFCGTGCRDAFVADPSTYVARSAG